MPLLNISTNIKVKNEEILLEKASKFISSILNKSENFVMVKLADSLPMYFAGNDQSYCFVEIKSIGSLLPSKMSKPICEFINAELNIPYERIYIFFQDVDSNMWAWNCKTFD